MIKWTLRRITGRRVDYELLAELEERERLARMRDESRFFLSNLSEGSMHQFMPIAGVRFRVCECGLEFDHHLHTGDRHECPCPECQPELHAKLHGRKENPHAG